MPRIPSLPSWALALLCCGGCGESLPEVEVPAPERRVLDAASARRKDTLDAEIADYRREIAAAEAEMSELEAKLSLLSPQEYLGPEARAGRDRIVALRGRIHDLRESLNRALDEVAVLSG